jgi:hypothetical protein
MTEPIRNRIKAHRRVRAGELLARFQAEGLPGKALPCCVKRRLTFPAPGWPAILSVCLFG